MQRVAKSLIIIVLAIAFLALAGWEWDIVLLERPLPHTAAMNPMTAVSIILLACSLWIIVFPGATLPRWTGKASAYVVVCICVLKMMSLAPGFPFHIDLILFRQKLDVNASLGYSDRMSLSTVVSMAMLVIGFLSMCREGGRGYVIAQSIVVLACLPSFFSIMGYLYRVQEFYGVFRYIPMAIHTSLCFFLLSLAFLLARPFEGIMKHFTSGLLGGVHARIFIPVAIFAPLILGLLRLYGYWAGLFSTEFGVTILVLSIIIVFSWTILYASRLLNRRDAQNKSLSAELTASEDQLRLLLNNIQDYAIFTLDINGIIASWNPGAEKIKGYKREEVIGKSICIFYNRSDIQKGIPSHNLEMAKSFGHYNSEGWRIRKDGTQFWADIVFTALYDEQGRLQGFAKITRDRTELRKSQELIAYQARLIEDTNDCIIALDPALRIISWNKGAEMLYGYSSRETIGRSLGDIVKPTSTEQRRIEILSLLQRDGLWKGEVVHFHRSGASLHLLISVSETRDVNGVVDGYVYVGRDITERKKEEDQLRRFNETLEHQVRAKTTELRIVFERISDGFMAFDRIGRITYVNQKAAELNNCKPDDLVGMDFWKRFPTASENEFGEYFHRALDTLENQHFEMFSPSLKLWIECYMYPSSDGLSFFFRDISEKRKAEEAIMRTSAELRLLASHLQDVREEERAMIAREIHDELGQQLTGIKMDIAWIAKRWNKQPEDPMAQKIKGTLGLLDNTIRTVRRIATELRPSILDDLGLVAAIEWQSHEFMERSGICTSFRSSIADYQFEPAMAIGLFRICQEALTNVARHSGAKNVWISLDSEEDVLILVIRDDGKGMDKKVKDKKTLGLLGMKERALMMGGSLIVEGIKGDGFRLEVSVPMRKIF
ncbi:MAG: PAS domain S-box protein [Bacteroidetes bacterium]|nr:PAS domain S-box protein [Bacteroidota bacterium]